VFEIRPSHARLTALPPPAHSAQKQVPTSPVLPAARSLSGAMRTMGRRSRVACVLARVLVLAAMAAPVHAQATVTVSGETGLRAAVANTSVAEVIMTADVSLTGGELLVPPNRIFTMRGACGATNTASCTLDANALSRHLHVTPGATVNVSNMRLVNGAAVSQAWAYTRPLFGST